MGIPRKEFKIDKTDKLSGVKVMSLVDAPAIESDFVFFKKEKPSYVELKSEKYKQIVFGPALIPDKDIVRYDAEGKQYFAYFTIDSIIEIRNDFHKQKMTSNVNLQHDSEQYVDSYLIESFIVDTPELLTAVKAKGLGDEVVLGSWVVSYKIEDKQTFEKVIKGELNGFSVEIFLQKFYKQDTNNFKEQLEQTMNKFFDKLKQMLAEAESEEVKKLESGVDEKGQTIKYGAKDEAVVMVDKDGKESPAPDGDYTLDNGKVVSVVSGVASDIKDAPQDQKKAEPAKGEEPKKDEKFEKLEADFNKLKEDLAKATARIEEFKKAPIANPVLKQDLKKSKEITEDEFKALSNKDQILYKNGLL